jgi:hypothetical protein
MLYYVLTLGAQKNEFKLFSDHFCTLFPSPTMDESERDRRIRQRREERERQAAEYAAELAGSSLCSFVHMSLVHLNPLCKC